MATRKKKPDQAEIHAMPNSTTADTAGTSFYGNYSAGVTYTMSAPAALPPAPRLAGHHEFQAAVITTPHEGWAGLIEDEIKRLRATADGVLPEQIVLLRDLLREHCHRMEVWKHGR